MGKGKPSNKTFSPSDRPKKTITKKRYKKKAPKKEMPKKYQTIRFFEKRKIIRKIEQIEKKIATTKLVLASNKDTNTDEIIQLEKDLEKWNNDLIYVKFYPKKEKYISLFPKNNFDQCDEKRQEMRIKAHQIANRIEERKKPKEEKLTNDDNNTINIKNNNSNTPEESSESSESSEEEMEQEEPEKDDFFL